MMILLLIVLVMVVEVYSSNFINPADGNVKNLTVEKILLDWRDTSTLNKNTIQTKSCILITPEWML